MEMGIVKVENCDDWVYKFVEEVQDPDFTVNDTIQFDGKYIWCKWCPFYYQVAIIKETDEYREISYIRCPSMIGFN